MSHCDVIVIGSGAGGGTLVHRLAPSGKRILILERGEYLPREKENWDARAVQLDGRYNPNEPWRDKRRQRLPARRQVLPSAATPRSGAPRPCACGRPTSARCATRAASRRRWPISYDELEPYYTQAEHLWRVRGARGVDPTEGPASAPVPPRADPPRGARAASCVARLRARRRAGVAAAARLCCSTRRDPSRRLHPLRHLRRLPVPGARQGRRADDLRRAGARATERDAADRRARHAARDRRVRARACARCTSSATGRARRTRPTSSWSPAARSTRRRCCCARPRRAIPTGSPTARASSGATTCATRTRPCSRSRSTTEPLGPAEDLRDQRLLPPRPRTASSRSA